ncbi:MAG TPA: altronate dehydratase family protein [Levilinea sp.]|nr:altronate dehydratase family protein [Levilinea sp.]
MKAYVDLEEIALVLNPADSVAIARQSIPIGQRICIAGLEAMCNQPVPAGHKIAVQAIAPGCSVLRYGQHIGVATHHIQPGDWVHSHNLEVGDMQRDFFIHLAQTPQEDQGKLPNLTFSGYPRTNGHYGTRNLIAVVSTVSCSAQAARAVAAQFNDTLLENYPNVDGVIAITHPLGCSVPEGGLAHRYLQRALLNLARHPNVAGIVYISLGCEVNQMGDLVAGLNDGCIPFLSIQELGGIRKTVQAGMAAVDAMLPGVNACERVSAPLSALCLALQCGGSDGWSGITANPLLGWVSDRIVSCGGTVVLAETPEIYGAEHLLTGRAASFQAGEKLIERIQWWQQQAKSLGFSLDNNPSPGNKAGGLTTIFEKSLGAVAKGGSTPLQAVYEYAERIEHHGLVFMDTPGNDPISITGQLAGGCNLIAFTTGRGSVYGSILAPCIKIATTTGLYEHMRDDMDFNAGAILDGNTLESAAEELLELIIACASGERTKSEWSGYREGEFVPWQPGAVV